MYEIFIISPSKYKVMDRTNVVEQEMCKYLKEPVDCILLQARCDGSYSSK
jgi:hypothetical protein